MARKYTGYDKTAQGRRAGTERLIDLIEFLSEGGLWNNGSFGVRNKRGKSTPSVHATGRAVDFSWRKMPSGRGANGYGNYNQAVIWMNFLTTYANDLEIEIVLDYFPRPFGRGWRCDRMSWINYSRRAFSGSPGGDWIHIEISPKVADDPKFFDDAFERIFSTLTNSDIKEASETKADPEPEPQTPSIKYPYPGRVLRRGDRNNDVKIVQAFLDAYVDGYFGPQTEKAVRTWQAANRLVPDGLIGPKTWKAMFG